MSVEKVKAFFAQYNMQDKILELGESSATVELAAAALHTEPCRIAKTMSFMVNGNAVLIVTAGDMKIDNSKFKSYFHEKVTMLTAEELTKYVGHAPGGVCPFAVPDTVKTYLDISMKRFQSVFPAAGSSNSCIELTLPDLEKYSRFVEWVDVCKPKVQPLSNN
ncbi:MAG: YbaK/EbsC family protein [Treponema sp.]